MPEAKVHYTELLPHEFRSRLAERPIAYLPLGTLEWHGEQLPLGSDGIISEGLMVRCARAFGGIVMPAIHLGPDRTKPGSDGRMLQGMDYAADVTRPHRQLDGSCYWVSDGLFMVLIDAILEQLVRAGFEAFFADGHGPSRGSWMAGVPAREARFGLKLLGAGAGLDGEEWQSQVDHAARNETSLVMGVRPDLVDLDQLDTDRTVWPQGVSGEDPRDATVAYGETCLASAMNMVEGMLTRAGV